MTRLRGGLAIGVAVMAMASACNDDTPGAQGGAGGVATGGSSGVHNGGAGGGPICERDGFGNGTPTATLVDGGNVLNVVLNTDETDFDSLAIQLFYNAGADSMPHAFTFTAEDYADCHTCALIYEDCNDMQQCVSSYLVESGTLDIDSNGTSGESFTATLSNARFIQVEIDPMTFMATPVQGGCVWTIDSVAIDATIN